jgi:hypothetical protein
LPKGATSLDAQWGDEISLVGIELPDTVVSGEYWQPVFYWSKETPGSGLDPELDPGQYNLSTRLVDDQGQVWDQTDQPLWQRYPPSEWPDETIIRYDPVYTLPAGVPPGDYQVWLRVTRDSDHQAMLTDGAVELLLSPSMTVEAAMAPEGIGQLPPHTRIGSTFGQEIELVGYQMPIANFRPGHVVPIDLYWRSNRPASADYLVQMQLLDERGHIVSEQDEAPARPDYPPSLWQEDQLLSGQVDLVIPASSEAGSYSVRIALIHPESGEPLAAGWPLGKDFISLSEITIVPWPLVTDLPPIHEPTRASFGQPPIIGFHGYGLAVEGNSVDDWSRINQISAGDALNLSLVWRSLVDDIPSSYTVFVHLANEMEEIVAQGDGVPVGGFRPTTSWRAGEVIQDNHLIPVPADTPAGIYRLWIGFFDPETGQRLRVTMNGEQLPDGRLLLQTVQVG